MVRLRNRLDIGFSLDIAKVKARAQQCLELGMNAVPETLSESKNISSRGRISLQNPRCAANGAHVLSTPGTAAWRKWDSVQLRWWGQEEEVRCG